MIKTDIHKIKALELLIQQYEEAAKDDGDEYRGTPKKDLEEKGLLYVRGKTLENYDLKETEEDSDFINAYNTLENYECGIVSLRRRDWDELMIECTRSFTNNIPFFTVKVEDGFLHKANKCIQEIKEKNATYEIQNRVNLILDSKRHVLYRANDKDLEYKLTSKGKDIKYKVIEYLAINRVAGVSRLLKVTDMDENKKEDQRKNLNRVIDGINTVSLRELNYELIELIADGYSLKENIYIQVEQ